MSLQRLHALRQRMQKENLGAIIITSPINRAYVSGFSGSAGILLITQDQAYLLVGFIYQEQAAAQAPGWTIVPQRENLQTTLADLLQTLGISKLGFEKAHVTYQQMETYEEAFAEAELEVQCVPYANIIEALRQVKDNEEIALMRKAAEIADHAFLHILSVIRAGISEKEVAIELESTMKRMGADGYAFNTIVVSGARSSMPHGKPTEKILEAGDFVTMDYGASYGGYCSDITRTVVIGKPSDEQRKVYQTVLQAHLRALNAVAPGVKGSELDALARHTITDAGYGQYFGHGLGHGIGRQVHEQPSAGKTSDSELQPGNVITIEPGIYIPNWGGVRIEDTVLVTAEGRRSLNHTTKELIIL